jgi:nitronate monooxygenase
VGARPGATFADVAELASGKRGRQSVLREGDLEGGMWWAGQSQGLINSVQTVEEIIDTIVTEAAEIMGSRLPELLKPKE